jgi:hypothetical protein
MKQVFLVACAIIMVAFSASVFAQATASATATATIVAPIAISNAGDMNFGNVAVINAGTVTLKPSDGTRTITGGITLPNVNGTVTRAIFHVTGEGSYTYAITLPSSNYTITRVAGTEVMQVNAFKSFPDVADQGALTSGAQTLYVGATLNVATAQVAGVYTNATGFDVTVNYN